MFDLWVSNADARQAIFFREFSSPHESTPTKRRWVAQMIDNGSGFGGTDWTFRESPVHCRHGQCAGYGLDISIRASAPWLDALMELRLDVLNEAVAELPRDWIRGDERALDAVLAQLYERRSRVPAMILQARLLAASQSVARDPNVLS